MALQHILILLKSKDEQKAIISIATYCYKDLFLHQNGCHIYESLIDFYDEETVYPIIILVLKSFCRLICNPNGLFIVNE
jgi:hypothetical protein